MTIFLIYVKILWKTKCFSQNCTIIGLSNSRILMNAFSNSHFTYCLLIWMCHSCRNNRKINRLREGCSRFIYNDKQSQFPELLEMDGSAFIDMKNIQSLAIEMFRDSRNLSPSIMNDIFSNKRRNSRCNLRQISKFSRRLVKSVYHGSKNVSFLEPKIWLQRC